MQGALGLLPGHGKYVVAQRACILASQAGHLAVQLRPRQEMGDGLCAQLLARCRRFAPRRRHLALQRQQLALRCQLGLARGLELRGAGSMPHQLHVRAAAQEGGPDVQVQAGDGLLAHCRS